MDYYAINSLRAVWGTEPAPSTAELGLMNDAYGPAVRLEQELSRWAWALQRLAKPSSNDDSDDTMKASESSAR
jgi:hypothetical protein